jgi:hypothetical protein
MKINFASVGNTALVISGAISAYLLTMNQTVASGVAVLTGLIVKAVCSEIDNQEKGQTTPPTASA